MITIENANNRIFIHNDFRGVFLKQSEYDKFVSDLETLARQMWPEKFEITPVYENLDTADVFEIKKYLKGYALVQNADGSTDMLDENELKKYVEADKKRRERQRP